MSWEAYDYIIVCYNMIIKCKISKKLLGKSETMVLFNKYCLILFTMNVLLEYFNIDIRNFVSVSYNKY